MTRREHASRGLQLRTQNQNIIELVEPFQLHVDAADFFIEDDTDTTKQVVFDVSAVTTATKRTITLPDNNLNLGSGVGGKANILASSGNTTMTTAMTGSIMLVDAASVSYALPAISAADVGMRFTFFWSAASTSNGVITAAAGDLLVGFAALGVSGAADVDYYFPNGSSHLVLTANGTTTGGLAGSVARFTAINATMWGVEAHLKASGTQATPFS